MLTSKERKMYRGWLARWRGLFDPQFVEELCKGDREMDYDYIELMMNSDKMGYRVDWLKKFMFPVLFMDCWSLYIMDTDHKVMMILDPTETNEMDEMKRKHEALAIKFQHRFCALFNDMFGAGLVEASGWKFLYPLVAQHDPCEREDSGVYVVHYFLEFTGLYLRSVLTQEQIDHLRKKIACEVVTMKGNKGDLLEILYDEIID